jgi:predicted GIY-YIG superfamily endonuclease
LYIGCTKNLQQRWRDHHRKAELLARGDTLSLVWEEMSNSPENLLQAEHKAITTYKPLLNKQPGRPSSSSLEDLPDAP